MTKEDWILELEKLGFVEIEEVEISAGVDTEEHTHDLHTAHVILEGQLIVQDSNGETTYRQGDFVEFPKGTTHIAFGGDVVGKMLVGFKYSE